MRKTKIEVKANIAIHADNCKAAWFLVDNWCKKKPYITDSNKKAEIDSTNGELAQFGINIITFFPKNICKTGWKYAIDNFIKCSNNELITLFIMSIEAESATYIEEFFIICYCQVDKFDSLI